MHSDKENACIEMQKHGQDEQDEQDSEREEEELIETIIGCSMTAHGALVPGFLEAVYAKALAHELLKAVLTVECEKHLTV
jgi:hypothetical protein